jgi:integrase
MIQKRGSRWRVVVQGGRDPLSGRRQQLSSSAPTEREAVKLERLLRLQAEDAVAGTITLETLVHEWWKSRPRLAATTAANYQNHILPVLGARTVAELRPRLIGSFLHHLGETKQLSPATLRKIRTVLSAVMSYATAMDYVESNPVMKVPPPELDASSRVAPTVEETARLLLGAEEQDPDFLTLLWVAAEEGGRRGETLALRWKDIDFENATLTISRSLTTGADGVAIRPTTNTGRGRTIAVSAMTLGHLGAHRALVEERLAAAAGTEERASRGFGVQWGVGSRRTPLDGKAWRPESTSRRFRILKERAGVRPGVDLHGLRHTMITELLAVGVDPRTVMGRAGHRSEATTMIVYAKVRPAVDSAAAEMWGKILNDKLRDLRPSKVTRDPKAALLK